MKIVRLIVGFLLLALFGAIQAHATNILVRTRDFNGSPLNINGKSIAIPRDVSFDADAATIEVLDRARIKYTLVVTGGTATGQVLIPADAGYGGTVPLTINGTLARLPVGKLFTPADGAIEALLRAGVPLLDSLGAPVKLGPIAVPIPVATYIPTVSTAPAAAYGMRRIVVTYSGSIFQAQRASDNATMDVAQDANGLPNTAPVVTWAAGSEVRIATWYDQSGNARNATAASFAEMPVFDATSAFGTASAFNAFKALLFDGWTDPVTTTRYPKKMTMPAGVAYNRTAFSLFMVVEPKSSIYNNQFYNLPTGGQLSALLTASSGSGLDSGNSGFGRRPRTQYQTIGITSGVGNYKFFQDDLILPVTAKSAAAMTGGLLGESFAGSSDFMSHDNWLGFVLYPAELSEADATSVKTALNATFGITAPTAAQVVMAGDSILWSGTNTGSQNNRSITRPLRALLTGNPALYNLGIPSQSLIGGMATNASTREFALAADGSYAKRILVIQIGTNDLGNNGGTAGYGATLYSAVSTYITNARAAGFTHIIIATLLPRSNTPQWQNPSSQQSIEMNDYNARVRANAAGADRVLDLAADPVMGSFANTSNTTYYQDGLHPTGAGNAILAPVYAAAINAILNSPISYGYDLPKLPQPANDDERLAA